VREPVCPVISLVPGKLTREGVFTFGLFRDGRDQEGAWSTHGNSQAFKVLSDTSRRVATSLANCNWLPAVLRAACEGLFASLPCAQPVTKGFLSELLAGFERPVRIMSMSARRAAGTCLRPG
jgi:hypothetical protein